MIEALHDIWERPVGRVLILLIAVALAAATVTLSPPLRNVIWWIFPFSLVVWGGSLVYSHGRDKPLSLVAGCLLMLGGTTRALFQLVPMDELTGTVANLIPVAGIFVEMFAHHYRENE